MPLVVRRLALVLVFVLAGCASQPEKPEKSPFEQRTEAVRFALTADIASRLITERCRAVGPELDTQAWQTRERWWERNRNLVMAADRELRGNLVGATGPRREATRAFLGLQLATAVVDNAREQVDAMLAEAGVTADNCRAVLASYRSGSRDLSASQQHYDLLVDMQYKHDSEAWQNTLDRLTERGTPTEYGESMIIVERLLERNACANPDVQLLVSDRPYELYEGSCGDGTHLVVACEWNDCRLLD